ncbi:MAG: TlpA disulfide reductase family protein [Sphingomicrobium sp.]
MQRLCAILLIAMLGACRRDQPPPANQAETDAGQVKGVDRSHKGRPGPDASFKDPDGNATSLAELEGKPLLVNLWASWCAPCVKELPTLARLSRQTDGVQVAAISQDSGPHASVVAFLEGHGAGDLAPFQDPAMALSGALGADVLPTSVLYDSQGREVWRYVGEMDWTSAEAARLLAEAGAAK